MELDLKDRACIVTGGSSGIGLATARSLVAEGASVLIVGRDPDRLRSAKELCEEGRGKTDVVSLDVTALASGVELLQECEAKFGRVDVLVNGAGRSSVRDLGALTDSDWLEQFELSVMAPKRAMDAIAPAMAAAGGGSIINVCSSAGRRPSSTNAAYAVAKRAEIALTVTYAERYGPDGVLINAVAPGPTDTPLWLGAGGLLDQLADEAGSSRERTLTSVSSEMGLGRLASAEEVASVITLLAAGTRLPSGEVWAVDAGHVPDVLG